MKVKRKPVISSVRGSPMRPSRKRRARASAGAAPKPTESSGFTELAARAAIGAAPQVVLRPTDAGSPATGPSAELGSVPRSESLPAGGADRPAPLPQSMLTRSGAVFEVPGEGEVAKRLSPALWEAVVSPGEELLDSVSAPAQLEATHHRMDFGNVGAGLTSLGLHRLGGPLAERAQSLEAVIAADQTYLHQRSAFRLEVKAAEAEASAVQKQINERMGSAPTLAPAPGSELDLLYGHLAELRNRADAFRRAIRLAALYSPTESTASTQRALDDALPDDLAQSKRLLQEAHRDMLALYPKSELVQLHLSSGAAPFEREAELRAHVEALSEAASEDGIPTHDLDRVVAMSQQMQSTWRECQSAYDTLVKKRDQGPLTVAEDVRLEQFRALADACEGQLKRLQQRTQALLLDAERDPVSRLLSAGFAQLVERFLRDRVGASLEEVPQLVDALLDLRPIELERLCNHLVDYSTLRQEGVFHGPPSVEHVVQILSGQLEGRGEPLPATVQQAHEMVEEVRKQLSGDVPQPAAPLRDRLTRLEAVEKRLSEVKQFRGFDRTGLALSLAGQVGVEGFAAANVEVGVVVGARDRKTRERSHRLYGAVEVETPINAVGYTLKHMDTAEKLRDGRLKGGLEWSVNPPYVYGGHDPVLGTNVGVNVPMVGAVVLTHDMLGIDYSFLELGSGAAASGFVAVSDPRVGRVTGPLIRGLESAARWLKRTFTGE